MAAQAITIYNDAVRFFDDSIAYFQNIFSDFDITLFNVVTDNNTSFSVLYAYSYDKVNYSEYVAKDVFELPVLSTPLPVYISVMFKKLFHTDNVKPLTIQQNTNVNTTLASIELTSITYDGDPIDFLLEQNVKFITYKKVINEYPLWNFYDKQQVTIDLWKKRLNATAEMYGHTAIYFRAEAVETNNTFGVFHKKSVVDVKMLHIQFPNNDLPQDKNIYSDWDMPLADETMIHIVDNKFKFAFGEKTIPLEKDYLYLPLLNKMFRVSGVQPSKTGSCLGKLGWWEVFLAKYEQDETITFDDKLKKSMENVPNFDEALSVFETSDNDAVPTEMFNELTTFEQDTVYSEDKVLEATIEEKKEATQNLTNKLVDSTHYVSLKETDKIREMISHRLAIVSVNPDKEAFPITMYNNATVDKRVVSLQYTLADYTTHNKFSCLVDGSVDNSFSLSFNFVMLNRFVGEIFDLLVTDGTFSAFTIKSNRNKLQIVDNRSTDVFLLNHEMLINELYNIVLTYNFNLKQLAIKLFTTHNKQKSIVYQDIYLTNVTDPQQTFTFSNLQMYGGNYLCGDITFDVKQKTILRDYVNPVLTMNNFKQ